MLEHPCLWLSAPTTAAPFRTRAGNSVRTVFDADSRELLGHVACAAIRWWPWQRGGTLSVYEAPDAALVFRAKPNGWFRPLTGVEDADGRVVAIVRQGTLSDRFGALLAMHQRDEHGKGGRFVGPTGAVLADWRPDGVGTRVCFHPPVFDEPFAKMGLLAAVLTV